MRHPHARWTSALLLSTLAATGIAFVGRGAEAQESKDVVTVQARILQNGVPVNADLDLTFEVYTASGGGTKLWSESQTAVPVRNGILAISLGTASALGSTFKNGFNATSERWLAVKQGGTEIVPRIRLTAVPYAQAAGTAEVASAIWNSSTSTSLTLSGLVGTGLEQDGTGKIRIAGSAAGNGLTGGSGSALAVNPGALINGGAAAIDADRLRIDLSSSLNYTPDFSSTGGLATASTDLTAHLKGISNALTGGGGGGSSDGSIDIPGGRLSASSSDAVPTTDVTAATLIYYLPYRNNRIPLWDGSTWVVRNFSPANESGISASLSGKSANTNYDIFAWWDTTGTPAVKLEIGTAWSSNTARNAACEISRFNGVLVKDVSGTQDRTRRYLGTIRCLAAGQTEDSNSKRFVWNVENQTPRASKTRDSTTSWSTNSTTYIACNSGNAAWRQDFVIGLSSATLTSTGVIGGRSTSPGLMKFTLYLDGASTSSSDISEAEGGGNYRSMAQSRLVAAPGAGHRYVQAMHAVASATLTWYSAAYNGGLVTNFEN